MCKNISAYLHTIWYLEQTCTVMTGVHGIHPRSADNSGDTVWTVKDICIDPVCMCSQYSSYSFTLKGNFVVFNLDPIPICLCVGN